MAPSAAVNGRGPRWNSGAAHMNQTFPKKYLASFSIRHSLRRKEYAMEFMVMLRDAIVIILPPYVIIQPRLRRNSCVEISTVMYMITTISRRFYYA